MKYTVLFFSFFTITNTIFAVKPKSKNGSLAARKRIEKRKKEGQVLHEKTPLQKLNAQIEQVECTLNPIITNAPAIAIGAMAASEGLFCILSKPQKQTEIPFGSPCDPSTVISLSVIAGILGIITKINNPDYQAMLEWKALKKVTLPMRASKDRDLAQDEMVTFLESHTRLFPNTEKLRKKLLKKTNPSAGIFDCFIRR